MKVKAKGVSRIVSLFVLLIGIAVIGSLFIEPNWRVEAVLEIEAPGEPLFALCDDLRAWPRWMVWDQPYPEGPSVYSGSETGVGSLRTFENGEYIEIVKPLRHPTLVTYRQTMKGQARPLRGTFELLSDSESTLAAWIISGKTSGHPLARYKMHFFQRDKMEKDMMQSMLNMKALCEKQEP